MNKVKKYKSITKQITFPQKLMDRVDVKAASLGYSFPAYVRYVLTKEVENQSDPVLDGIVMDKDMVNSLKKGVEEYKRGKTVELRSNKEIKEYVKRIVDEES